MVAEDRQRLINLRRRCRMSHFVRGMPLTTEWESLVVIAAVVGIVVFVAIVAWKKAR
jgi:hypothetical protein